MYRVLGAVTAEADLLPGGSAIDVAWTPRSSMDGAVEWVWIDDVSADYDLVSFPAGAGSGAGREGQVEIELSCQTNQSGLGIGDAVARCDAIMGAVAAVADAAKYGGNLAGAADDHRGYVVATVASSAEGPMIGQTDTGYQARGTVTLTIDSDRAGLNGAGCYVPLMTIYSSILPARRAARPSEQREPEMRCPHHDGQCRHFHRRAPPRRGRGDSQPPCLRGAHAGPAIGAPVGRAGGRGRRSTAGGVAGR